MSKITFYAVVGIGALLVGGFALWLVVPAGVDENAEEANIAAPREFAVEGMHCQGCADSVAAALTEIPGVKSAHVSFADKRAVVLATESEVTTDKILAAIAAAGYQAHTK